MKKGIIIGGIAGLLLVGAAIFYFKKRKSTTEAESSEEEGTESGSAESTSTGTSSSTTSTAAAKPATTTTAAKTATTTTAAAKTVAAKPTSGKIIQVVKDGTKTATKGKAILNISPKNIFQVGDTIKISGSKHYNGAHKIMSIYKGHASRDAVTIDAAYVASDTGTVSK
jgi:hypothetical protein